MITLYPDVLRKSTMIKLFRARAAPGFQRAIDEIEKVHRMFPSCIEHGKLEDPIIAVSGKGEIRRRRLRVGAANGLVDRAEARVSPR